MTHGRDVAIGLGGIAGICAYALVRNSPPRWAAAVSAGVATVVGAVTYEAAKSDKGHLAQEIDSGAQWVGQHPLSAALTWVLITGGFNLVWTLGVEEFVAPFLYIVGVTNVEAVPIVLAFAAAVATVIYGAAMGWPMDTLMWMMRGFAPDPKLMHWAMPNFLTVDANGNYSWVKIPAEDSVPPFYSNDSSGQNARHLWGLYWVPWDLLRAALAMPIKLFDAIKSFEMSDIGGSLARLIMVPVDGSLYAVTMLNNAVVDVIMYGAHIARQTNGKARFDAVLDFGTHQPGPIFNFQNDHNGSPWEGYMVIPGQ